MKRIDIITQFVPTGGIGVEVGVCEGHFSEEILDNWQGVLYSVDSWKHFEGVYQDPSNVSQDEHDEIYRKCADRLRRFGTASLMVREESVLAAKRFDDRMFDFVYLDARHDYRSVKADLEAWYPKVRKGGVLAGHDYFNATKYRHNLVEVKRAVDDFFRERNEIPQSTGERRLPSWWIIKSMQA